MVVPPGRKRFVLGAPFTVVTYEVAMIWFVENALSL